MQRPVAIDTLVPGGSVLIDIAAISRIDEQWAAPRFGTRIDFCDGKFVTVSANQVKLLRDAGLIEGCAL